MRLQQHNVSVTKPPVNCLLLSFCLKKRSKIIKKIQIVTKKKRVAEKNQEEKLATTHIGCILIVFLLLSDAVFCVYIMPCFYLVPCCTIVQFYNIVSTGRLLLHIFLNVLLR